MAIRERTDHLRANHLPASIDAQRTVLRFATRARTGEATEKHERAERWHDEVKETKAKQVASARPRDREPAKRPTISLRHVADPGGASQRQTESGWSR